MQIDRREVVTIAQQFKVLGIEEVLKLLDKYKWKELHIHHTWKPEHKDFNGTNHIALQQGMYDYHVYTKKWDNIAQHLTLCPDGQFVTGRPLHKMPVSIYGQNKKGALAVEMIGNFDIGHDILDGEQKLSILVLVKYFTDKRLPIKFHNEYSDKTCPGTSINKADFIKEVVALGEIFRDFTQVPEWAKKDIEEAKELGIVRGDSNGNLNPNQPITRLEAIVITMRAIRLKGE